MCCCDQPNINGELGYKWKPTEKTSIRPPQPPTLADGDILLYDEPGRCGGIDSHSHHYRIVKSGGRLDLLVRHGGGDDRFHLSLYGTQPEFFASLDSNGRYWLFNALYHARSEGNRQGYYSATEEWRTAAIEKRIKTRKVRGGDAVKVWIEN